MDIRHGPSPDDRQMNAWLRAMDMPYLLVATKADKISRGQYSRQAKIIRQDLGGLNPFCFPRKHGRAASRFGRLSSVSAKIRKFAHGGGAVLRKQSLSKGYYLLIAVVAVAALAGGIFSSAESPQRTGWNWR